VQRYCKSDDGEGAREDASAANTCDHTSHDKNCGSGSRPAYGRTNLEDDDGDQVDPFDGVVRVQLAVEELEGARGEQICRAIPADVVDGAKVVTDAWDCCGNDGVIL
jgi:hypothetical protein